MSRERLPPAQISDFRSRLLAWYDAHARDLPWRRTRDPYAVWVSEIMLQQTRVAAVLDHYARFLERFPSVVALALAPEEDVLSIWSGLGYYRRARMLHRAARVVAAEHRGAVPQTAAGLRTLPGIGEYTSAAIASISFREPVAVVDGNVERVLMRVAALPAKPGAALDASIRMLAAKLVAPERPGDFNQAMMELGAVVCLPRNPLCLECPVQRLCRTRGEHESAPRKKMIRRDVTYALITRARAAGLEVLLEQRPADLSLMPGMWELPEIADAAGRELEPLLTVRHAITTTNYVASILKAPAGSLELLRHRERAQMWVQSHMLSELPLTGLARKVLRRLRILPEAAVIRSSGSDAAD
jgi:A/G-specific adenine glycosylase